MYTVAIRNNETGEIRMCAQDLERGAGSDFWWTDGNMACDCNRALTFARVGNENALTTLAGKLASPRYMLKWRTASA